MFTYMCALSLTMLIYNSCCIYIVMYNKILIPLFNFVGGAGVRVKFSFNLQEYWSWHKKSENITCTTEESVF